MPRILLALSLVSAIGLLSAASAFAGTSKSAFSISSPNNVVVKQSQPNLMVEINETNNSGSAAWCNVRVPEINPDSGGYWVASSPFMLTTGQTGLGTAVPNTKKSSLTFELWCSSTSDGPLLLVASTTSKVTVAGQV
jgi:hypothetical protein